jgi:hypothetical protein
MVLKVGEPLIPPPPTPGGRTARRAVRELTETLRSRLQELFDQAEAEADPARAAVGAGNPPQT